MFVHRSNRMERLVEVLLEVVARPLPEVLARECIAVPGRGMEHWLALALARRLGVWANPDFPFPRALIERVIDAVLDQERPSPSGFEPESLLWAVAAALPQFLDHPEFAPLAAYLAGDDGGGRRLQLAQRIATSFDQYVVYRPQMVLDWEAGAERHWQAVLWRALVERHGSGHIAARAQRFFQALQRPPVALAGLPPRLSLFGLSTLPPLYVQILAALSAHLEVHLFLLSPSREYWAEIRSRRQQLRRAGAGAVLGDEGHALLASLGRLGREFQRVLESTVDYHEDDRDLYDDPGTATMLAALQSDMLWLRARRPESPEAAPLRLDPCDDSVRLHSCHSPMREVEVLHDQLLALFEADPELAPSDVVVMSPAIEVYAPLIDAVFGGSEQHGRIPYRIADRAVRATEEVVAAFLAVLRSLRGRMTATAVLDLLSLEPLRRRWGMCTDDLERVRTWVSAAGIRWGADAAHRQSVQQPPLAENTWQFGLDRLLLGYAMPGGGRRLYAGVLPYDDVEGAGAEVLGRLAEFCEALFGYQRALQTPRPLALWRDELNRLLHSMVAGTDDEAPQLQQIRTALAQIARGAEVAGFHEAVELETVQEQLALALEQNAPGRGFLTGAVTFCALVPMRSIPFRVVCLLGMNDADFPRLRRPPGFDLIAQQSRPGDRSAREDDRYLFLEAVLSARSCLLITFVGRSIRDNSELAPSVVVCELLDVLGESFHVAADRASAGAPAAAVRDHLLVRHPLQPFSPAYFGAGADARLFSFAADYCEGARALAGERGPAPPFVPVPLPATCTLPRTVSLDELVRFFANCARAFLQNRLGLYLGEELAGLDDREPLALDALARWQLGHNLLQRAVGGEDLGGALAAVRASGELPPGTLGECAFEAARVKAEGLAATIRQTRAGTPLAPLVIASDLDAGTCITGVLRDLWPNAQVHYQFSKLGGHQELSLWLRHLVLNWLQPAGYPRVSVLIGHPARKQGPAEVRFRPLDGAAAILRRLVNLYRAGQGTPLPFFPHASRRYAEAIRRNTEPARALEQARKAYEGDAYGRGDRADEYVQQAFGGTDPLQPDVCSPGIPTGFADLAVAVFAPLLDHREEVA